MLRRPGKVEAWGTLIGLLLGVLWGGLASALYGLPFSGATGLKAFLPGMLFGLIFFAPITAFIGAALGWGYVWLRNFWDERNPPPR
jgi:hypothetical protein